MGQLISWFKKKKSTADIIESLHNEIESIHQFNRENAASHKKLIGHLLTYFLVLYLAAAVFAYYRYFYHPEWQNWLAQLKLIGPFIVAPFVYIFLKVLVTWWFHTKIRKNEKKLQTLTKEKAKLLNDVMEIETYKVAKQILEKFAPEQLRASGSSSTLNKPSNTSKLNQTLSTPKPQQQQPPSSSSILGGGPSAASKLLGQSFNQKSTPAIGTEGLRRRLPRATPGAGAQRQDGGTPTRNAPMSLGTVSGTPSAFVRSGASGPPLPRPVLPRDRNYMDRFVEYLMGDGPNNRYALICKQCQSHNGMALKEEFEFTAFRCCYCHYWNPARKQRPTAPRLQQFGGGRGSGNQTPAFSSTVESSSSSDESEKEKSSENQGAKSSSALYNPQKKPNLPDFNKCEEETTTTAEEETPSAQKDNQQEQGKVSSSQTADQQSKDSS